jgi:hypothetical protein
MVPAYPDARSGNGSACDQQVRLANKPLAYNEQLLLVSKLLRCAHKLSPLPKAYRPLQRATGVARRNADATGY